jgi:hypothetical protein
MVPAPVMIGAIAIKKVDGSFTALGMGWGCVPFLDPGQRLATSPGFL